MFWKVSFSNSQILAILVLILKIGSSYSKRQIKRNDGSVQANCATKEILIPNWVISIPISIMFFNFTMLTFYCTVSGKPSFKVPHFFRKINYTLRFNKITFYWFHIWVFVLVGIVSLSSIWKLSLLMWKMQRIMH